MDDTTLALVLTFVGAFTGAIFAPFGEYFFERLLGRQINRISAGLVLLCAANGFWAIIAFVFNFLLEPSLALLIASPLYVISIVLFVSAFRFFSKFELSDNTAYNLSYSIFPVLKWLVLGNALWVLAEFIRELAWGLGLERASNLTYAVVLFCSVIVFFFGLFTLWRETKTLKVRR